MRSIKDTNFLDKSQEKEGSTLTRVVIVVVSSKLTDHKFVLQSSGILERVEVPMQK